MGPDKLCSDVVGEDALVVPSRYCLRWGQESCCVVLRWYWPESEANKWGIVQLY